MGISAFIYILSLLNYQYWSAAFASIFSYPVYSNKCNVPNNFKHNASFFSELNLLRPDRTNSSCIAKISILK